jgi:hypothetical protein
MPERAGVDIAPATIMRTLLVEQGGTAPDELREIVERGSTELLRDRGTGETPVDRVVIWDAKGPERGSEPVGGSRWPDTAEVMIVAPDTRGVPAAETSNVFAWPADADRLKMAFMTGG